MIESRIIGRKNMDNTITVFETESTSTTVSFLNDTLTKGSFRISFNLKSNKVRKGKELEGIDLTPEQFRRIAQVISGRL